MENSTNPLPAVLRQELINAKEQGQKLSDRKILIVIALLGIGSIQIDSHTHVYQLLWIVPLIACCFDFLELEQKYCVRRIGAFLQYHSDNLLEKTWETYVSSRRGGVRLRLGDIILSVLTYIAPLLLLYHIQVDCQLVKLSTPAMCSRILNIKIITWFVALGLLHLIALFEAGKALKKLKIGARDAPISDHENDSVDLL
jgi:hypothetical protein